MLKEVGVTERRNEFTPREIPRGRCMEEMHYEEVGMSVCCIFFKNYQQLINLTLCLCVKQNAESEVESEGEEQAMMFNHVGSRLCHYPAWQLPLACIQSNKTKNDGRRRRKVVIAISYDMLICLEALVKRMEVLKRCSLVLESDMRITIRKVLRVFWGLLYHRTRRLQVATDIAIGDK